jgi:hypothetical protein
VACAQCGPIEIELEGILRVYKIDQTTLFFDARSAEDFAKASLPGTHNVPLDCAHRVIVGPVPIRFVAKALRLVPAGSDRAALKELAPTCADRGHWEIVMCRFLWGIAALEVYLGLYRLARPVGAGLRAIG